MEPQTETAVSDDGENGDARFIRETRERVSIAELRTELQRAHARIAEARRETLQRAHARIAEARRETVAFDRIATTLMQNADIGELVADRVRNAALPLYGTPDLEVVLLDGGVFMFRADLGWDETGVVLARVVFPTEEPETDENGA